MVGKFIQMFWPSEYQSILTLFEDLCQMRIASEINLPLKPQVLLRMVHLQVG